MSDKQEKPAEKVDDHKQELCKLGELAFDALLQDLLYFPVSKLSDQVLTEKLIEAGLFQLLNMTAHKRCKAVHFIHKSLQEFLGKLSLLWLAITRLPRKLGHNSSPKTSHGAILLNRELKQARQRRQWERQNSNSFRLAKQQLCTYITLFRTFLCRRCTTTTWKCAISGFVEDLYTRQQLLFSFPELWYRPSEFNS